MAIEMALLEDKRPQSMVTESRGNVPVVNINNNYSANSTVTEVGGVHIKTVQKLNSDAVVAELELGVVSDLSSAAVLGPARWP